MLNQSDRKFIPLQFLGMESSYRRRPRYRGAFPVRFKTNSHSSVFTSEGSALRVSGADENTFLAYPRSVLRTADCGTLEKKITLIESLFIISRNSVRSASVACALIDPFDAASCHTNIESTGPSIGTAIRYPSRPALLCSATRDTAPFILSINHKT